MCVFPREQILSQHQQECAYLEDVTFAMEQFYMEVDGEARQDYQSTRDDIKNRVGVWLRQPASVVFPSGGPLSFPLSPFADPHNWSRIISPL